MSAEHAIEAEVRLYDRLFKKENPEVFFVSINASKQKDHPFIDEYKLFNTPTYVLINNKGEKIVRRVGTFNPTYFKKYLA